MKNVKIICLCGKSGSGKSSIAEEIAKDGLKMINSFTTRKPRYDGEVGHIFTDKKQYECNKANRLIVAETYFNNNYYWTTKGQLQENCVYVIDVKGVKDLKENLKNADIIVIYLKCSRQNRYIRMMARDKDNNKALERIEHDIEAFKDAEAVADYIIDANKPLRKVIEDVKEILNSVI